MYRVVLAEDEQLVRMGLVSMINWQAFGMQIVFDGSNGAEALDAFHRLSPDILITDVRMPVMDGIELIRRVRTSDKRIRVVILTCLDEFALVQQALSLDVSAYILKLTSGIPEIEAVLKSIKSDLDGRNDQLDQTPWVDHGLVKEQILFDYIRYRKLPVDAFRTTAARLHFRLTERGLCVAILRLSAHDRLLEPDPSGRRLRAFVIELIDQLLRKKGVGEIFCDHPSEYIVLFSGVDTDENIMDEMLIEISREIDDYLGVDVRFGVSGVMDGFEMLPRLNEQAREAIERRGERAHTPRVRMTMDYINRHYRDNISLQSAADHIGVSPNYLSRLFIRDAGQTFTDALNLARVERAKAYLAGQNDPVYRIGESVGIPSSTYFIRVFKKHVGVTPNEYRNALREKR